MADLRLDIKGDGSDAADGMREVARAAGELEGATKRLGDSTKKSAESAKMSIADWQALGGQIMSTASGIIEFSKQSIAAFSEQEKADKQLEMVAGDLTDAFKEQASQMQASLGVSDDMVERMQTLALRYGTLATNVEPATRAILDWAAATGGDAESGMQTLTRSIEFGQGKIKGLGIEFETTGDKTKDLERAVAALTAKFGGSADAMADTLAGRTGKLTEAFGELKEALGGAFDTVDRGLGFTDTLATGFRNLSTNISDFITIAKNAANFNWGEWLAHGTGGAGAPFSALGAGTRQFDTDGTDADPADGVRAAAPITKKTFSDSKVEKKSAEVVAKRAEKRLSAEQKANDQLLEEARRFAREEAEIADRHMREAEERGLKAQQAEESRADRAFIKKLARQERDAENEEKEVEKKIARAELAQKRMQEATEKQNKKFEDSMTQAGITIGLAFANSLSTAMEQALNEEEVDGAAFALDILSTILSVVGGVVGGAIGNAPGAAIGGMVGSVLGTGAKALYKSTKKKGSKRHDGGIIESYHSGGWPGMTSDEEMAVLQRGEAVWSRNQVAAAGGPAAVDAMRKGLGGRGGSNITINALDSRSLTEMFGGRGARAIYNNTRTGRGQLAEMFAR